MKKYLTAATILLCMAAMTADDPAYPALVKEIGDISKLLLDLPKTYKVII